MTLLSSPPTAARGVFSGTSGVLRQTRGLLNRPALGWAFAFCAFVSAFFLRYFLDESLPAGFPYLTFFPAVILTAYFAGTTPGTAVAVACGIASWYFFIPPFSSFELYGRTALALGFYAFIVTVDILIIHAMDVYFRRLDLERRNSAALADQRAVLFKELQHRVSNNLSVVSALLNAQRRLVEDEKASGVLAEAAARIALISRLQRRLHDPNSQMIVFDQFLREVGVDVMESAGVSGIAYEVDAEPLAISGEKAVPLALIAAELLANAVEHGVVGKTDGKIVVSFKSRDEDQERVLTISDNGPGLPEGFDPSTSRSLGMRIVHALVVQLGGTLSFDSRPGAQVQLVYPTGAQA